MKTRPAQRLHAIARSLRRNGCLEKAEAAFRAALASDPDSLELRTELILLRREMADWHRFDRDVDWIRERVALDQPIPPFATLVAGLSANDQLRAARRWGRALDSLAAVSRAPATLHPAMPIRIGYLSADFQCHATSFLIAELLARHDRQRFSVTAYSLAPDDGGAERRDIVASVERFVDLQALDDEAAATRIADDGIDLLIDLKGYTNGTRMGILARRPAPVQIGFLGYPGTTGRHCIDYIVADPIVAPAAAAATFDECLLHMPHCYQPNDSRRHLGTRPSSREELGLPKDGFLFGCFNTVSKITPTTFDAWMQILAAVPGSHLCLLGGGGPAEANLAREAEARSIAATRLVFLPRVDPAAHLARHHAMDLLLDCWPYSAHTTAADALWEGVPLLTLEGEGFAGRVAASVARAADVPELVTATPSDYVALAIGLAAAPARLLALRHRLADRAGPLFDTAGYAAALEHLFGEVVERHRAGLRPRAILSP